MEVEAAKLIGAGLAVVGLGGVGVGIGNIFSSMISSGARTPAAIPSVQTVMWIGFAEQARCPSSIRAPSRPSCSGCW